MTRLTFRLVDCRRKSIDAQSDGIQNEAEYDAIWEQRGQKARIFNPLWRGGSMLQGNKSDSFFMYQNQKTKGYNGSLSKEESRQITKGQVIIRWLVFSPKHGRPIRDNLRELKFRKTTVQMGVPCDKNHSSLIIFEVDATVMTAYA